MICLLRHGHCSDGVLSSRGEKQLDSYISNLKLVKRIVVTEHYRPRETARFIRSLAPHLDLFFINDNEAFVEVPFTLFISQQPILVRESERLLNIEIDPMIFREGRMLSVNNGELVPC